MATKSAEQVVKETKLAPIDRFTNAVISCYGDSENGIKVTDREKDIIKQVAEGLSNKEIAGLLFLSEGTVRNYISIVLEKLELRDRTQLAIFYYKNT